MNMLTRLCLATTADVLDEIVHAVRRTLGTTPEAAALERTQQEVVVRIADLDQLVAALTQRPKRFGR